ncbi:MAG: DNA repair exonuclease [Rhodobacteraceae bacterium]|nr:DNA repair exonuclease [Paracoccaceae bacterium]
MIRILHTADVHLDSPLRSLALRDPELRDRIQTASRVAFSRIVDSALDEDAAALLISGDLFDRAVRSAQTAAFLTVQLERLRDDGIRVFYIKGNHDADNPLTGELSLPENVHIFDGRGGKIQLADNVWIHGVSFANRHAPASLLPKFQAPVAGAVNIAMLHTSLASPEGHDPYAPCAIGDLTAAGFDYWALGHVHRRQVHSSMPWVIMPGTPQGRDIGEPGPKSATLLTIGETICTKEIPTSVVEFLRMRIDVSDVEDDDALRVLLRQKLRDKAQSLVSASAVIRLELTGRTPRCWQMLRDQDFWTEIASEYARETGTLWLDKVIFNLSDSTAPGHSATDELAEIMRSIREDAHFTRTCRTEIEDILNELPQNRREELVPDETAMDRLVQDIAGMGTERILACMKGVTS